MGYFVFTFLPSRATAANFTSRASASASFHLWNCSTWSLPTRNVKSQSGYCFFRYRTVSMVKDSPSRSSSQVSTRICGSFFRAISSMAFRCSPGVSCRLLSGACLAGMNHTSSASSWSRAAWAMARCPACTGSKDPPRSTTRRRVSATSGTRLTTDREGMASTCTGLSVA